MMQIYHVSYVAVIVAAIASIVWSWMWHNWACGKKWADECGMHFKLDKQEHRMAIAFSFIGALLTAYVIHRLLNLSQAANLMPDKTAYKYGFCIAFSAWIGFYVPMMLNATVWMKKSWKFFFAKSFVQLINLVIIALILAYWTTLNKV